MSTTLDGISNKMDNHHREVIAMITKDHDDAKDYQNEQDVINDYQNEPDDRKDLKEYLYKKPDHYLNNDFKDYHYKLIDHVKDHYMKPDHYKDYHDHGATRKPSGDEDGLRCDD